MAVIAVLPALEPTKTQNFGLFLRLEQLKQSIQPDLAIGDDQLKFALNRHGRDPRAVMALLEHCCALNDRALADLRPMLEHQLDRFSGFVISAPKLLTLHPAPDGLSQPLQQRQLMLDQLLANLAPQELRTSLRAPRRLGRRPRLVVASGTKARKKDWIEGFGTGAGPACREA